VLLLVLDEMVLVLLLVLVLNEMVLVLEAIEYEYRFAEYRFAEYEQGEIRCDARTIV
jgi:hypothetical protein